MLQLLAANRYVNRVEENCWVVKLDGEKAKKRNAIEFEQGNGSANRCSRPFIAEIGGIRKNGRAPWHEVPDWATARNQAPNRLLRTRRQNESQQSWGKVLSEAAEVHWQSESVENPPPVATSAPQYLFPRLLGKQIVRFLSGHYSQATTKS